MKKTMFLILVLKDHDDPDCVASSIVEALKDCSFLKHGESIEVLEADNTIVMYRSFPRIGFRRGD